MESVSIRRPSIQSSPSAGPRGLRNTPNPNACKDACTPSALYESQCDWPKKTPRLSGAFKGADDGTRTHDLLHGKSQRSSQRFSPVRSNSLIAASSAERANPTERERTPNLAILATP